MGAEQKTFIERWGAIAVAITAILGLVFLLFPHLRPRDTPSDSSRTTTPGNASTDARTPARPGDVVLGTWQQLNQDPSGQWQQVGTFVVSKADVGYAISAREQAQGSGVINSIGIFDVRSDGIEWTFNSNWGRGLVGNFRLQKVSETVFEGTISVEGRVVQRTRWVRVQ